MKKLILTTLLLGGATLLPAQKPTKTPATYKPVKTEMYRKGWIDFNRANGLEADFEIQLSGGGGQFLTVYSGTVREYNKRIPYPFKGTTASDLRIVLGADGLGIAEVEFSQKRTRDKQEI